mgnify:CR=1 FL=1
MERDVTLLAACACEAIRCADQPCFSSSAGSQILRSLPARREVTAGFAWICVDLRGRAGPLDEEGVSHHLDEGGAVVRKRSGESGVQLIGSFDTELVREFFQALSTHAGITLHVDMLHGLNSHHIAEATFKSVARALRAAVAIDPRSEGQLPSTKGAL